MDKVTRHAKEPPTVLIVEDQPGFSGFLRPFLEDQGHRTLSAAGGLQAKEILWEQVPDLILLELMLSQETGFRFYCELRTHKNWRHIPIIVILAEEADRQRLLSYCKFLRGKNVAPPEACLQKTASGDDLRRAVEDVLSPGGRSVPRAFPGNIDPFDPETIHRVERGVPDHLPVFEALGNSIRLQMLELMASHKEICVCELVQILGLSQSGISSHLTVLRRAGIVKSRKEGLWVFYAVDLEAIQRAFAAIEADLGRLLQLSASEDPDSRLREKVESGTCCATSANRIATTPKT